MHWIVPSEKNYDNAALEKRLWDAADQFRANSGLKSQGYSSPVLGLIFLRFAEVCFAEARFDYLFNRPEAENIGARVKAAMRDAEKHNTQLGDVLSRTYNLFTSILLKELLKRVSEIPASLDYDAFGRHEYFLGEFAMSEAQGGGEFNTPSSIARLLTEGIEPHHERILDPACSSDGVFVSFAQWLQS